jgi:DNA polymerase-3 subunit delta
MASRAALHLVLGDDEFLIERAIGSLVREVRASADNSSATGEDVTATRLRAGNVTPAQLAELLSPSLFAEDRVLVLEAADEAGKDSAALVLDAATAPPDGVTLIIVHSGGGRTKSMVPALHKAGAVVHSAAKLNANERADFVRNEFRSHGVHAAAAVVAAVLEAVGSNLRDLASACSQLAADTGGRVDIRAVQRYYKGKAEVSGFEVADRSVAGERSAALESLRWALHRGVPLVVLADALGEAVRTIARVNAAGRGDPNRLAPQLGMPPWRVRKAQNQLRGWTPANLVDAMGVVAALNADVKGGAADAEFALERAVTAVAQLASR